MEAEWHIRVDVHSLLHQNQTHQIGTVEVRTKGNPKSFVHHIQKEGRAVKEIVSEIEIVLMKMFEQRGVQ